jgi:hypothetical protein
MKRTVALSIVCLIAAGCSDDDATSSEGTAATMSGGGEVGGSGASGSDASGTGGLGFGGSDSGSGSGAGSSVEMFPELWYSVDQLLVLVTLDDADGSVASIQSSTITSDVDIGQTAITMLDDGSLLAARLSEVDNQSHFFHFPSPPRDGSDVAPASLGVMPDGIMLEGLYTDCEGRVYGMDTGADNSSSVGNRLLRFTGSVASGDFTFVVVSDLASADVADIDDMGPGIDDNQITDNPGLAIDTGNVHAFDYETGSGTQVAQAGTFGIHALGGPLFTDDRSRLYVLNDAAELFEIDPTDFSASNVLVTGPTPAEGIAGWSGLAGPLTDCESGFSPPN